MAPKTDAMSIILEALAPLSGKQILDIGCGAGTLARSLSNQGACVSGVDPNSETLEAARQAAPMGTFRPASAEALPFVDHSFDSAIFLNSFHHIPKTAMPQALQEAARVVKPAEPVIVIEPLAEGSFFSALRPVEDETDVRTAAQDVLHLAVKRGLFEQLIHTEYLRHEHFTDVDQFVTHIVAVDSTRASLVAMRRPEVEATFQRNAKLVADGSMVLDQPMRALVLRQGHNFSKLPSNGLEPDLHRQ